MRSFRGTVAATIGAGSEGVEQASRARRVGGQGDCYGVPAQSVAEAGASSQSAAVLRRANVRLLAQSETW